MQTPAFMILGKIRQAMGRLDGELLEDFHNLLRDMARPTPQGRGRLEWYE